jgi:hypothetical protein
MKKNVKIQDDTQSLQSCVSKSVLLTGKCLIDYENGVIQLINNIEENPITDNIRCLEWIDQTNNLIKIEHYILWFDSIGITVDIMPRINEDKVIFEPNTFCLKHEITTEDFIQFDNRLDAKIKAIEKANEIYNEYFV